MNPPCARCKKTVYPTEKLACLDKYWHKGCFNCEVCSMTLSMKTYKGYQKLPYCNTHYPKTKFTPVAETPENMRLKKNTENQSSVIYHKEFEQDKGKLTTVADDPESLRLAKTQKQASDLSYQNKIKSQASIDRAPQEEAPQAQHSQHSQQQAPQHHVQPAKQQVFHQPPAPVEVAPVKAPVAAPAPAPPAASVGHKYVALYDYTAADDDEVTFVEGDYITNGEIIDDGWMTGTVERTGENGMLPSNYVEAC